MSRIGQVVSIQHRVAVGHARTIMAGTSKVREHLPVPTELQTHSAIVIGESPVASGEPRVTAVYKKDDSQLNPVELQSGFAPLYDVPHKSEAGAEEAGLFWEEPSASAAVAPVEPAPTAEERAAFAAHQAVIDKALAEEAKLKTFLLSNFKSETGDETPVDCAIRLLSKTKKK